ncbi:ubiquinone biosynthesis monooxygenase COQ6, mitochondrial [Cynara cardunculus var. scolymus]|uniref:ubiquinone biosynthesis monooxygenase COQ6, mitochondrial n=1 Tax=Cynara cardunculus var. scolymus TaxID=59895 RepID=UPI000D62B966|nr:ubiquinone biosynthesis monooxygenase COQ6, mitochondrial [Cynara cardunculus var. scolymus]
MSRFIATRRLASNIFVSKSATRTFCNDAPSKLNDVPHGSQFNKELEDEQGFTNDIPQYDIAIVGGGMVGMALACSLASMPLTKQLSIAIIDSNPALTNGSSIKKDDPPDPRVSTVTPATISLFKGIGAWQYVEQHRHAYFDRMQVWDYTGFGYTRYNARDADKDVLGCVVENKVLHKSLLSCLQNKDFKKTIYPTRLSSMSLPTRSSVSAAGASQSKSLANLAKLELSDGTNLYAKLVVGADGSKSHVRELAGIKTTGWNYSQSAVICTVEHSAENFCAWQRFLPAGPIALLPIGDNFSNIVWTMSPKEASNHKIMSEDDFVKAVNHALDFGYGPHPESQVFGSGVLSSFFRPDVTSSANEGFELPPKVVKVASQRMAFPLSLMHANQYASKRVVLIGDAAHTVHPLAGQGVNMGYGDAASLSNVIADGVAVGSDIGEVTLLKKYEADRKTANITMMAVLDGFQKAYSVDFGPLNILRAAAFNGANVFAPLKKNIISYASGERRLPFLS